MALDHHSLPLAVYGTLRPGGRAYQAFALDRRTRHIGPCRIIGRLVDLGGYPGLLPPAGGSADNLVAGDLLDILDPGLWDELDHYEGPDYRRETVRLANPAVDAQLWMWRHDGGNAPPVPGNDWFLRQSEEIDPADDPANRASSSGAGS